MLRHRVPRLDAVLLTHEHRDHISGLDDLRAYNFAQDAHIPVYGLQRCLDDLRRSYAYMFGDYPGAPRLTLHPIDENSQLQWQGLNIQPIGIQHGKLPILGYRIGNFAYLTDVKQLPEHQLSKLQGLEVLVLNALHHEGHPTHLSLPEALDLIQVLQPQQTYLTHISHRMGLHLHVEATLPPQVHLAYDGLHFSVS
jgi:phosphoribosyl 1,2-cyclic phosphate phosphodiesterase